MVWYKFQIAIEWTIEMNCSLLQVASLELVCTQHEKVVKEKEQQLKDQQGHLDKYAQMSAMIHSLTSGTVSIVKNEEKPVAISKKK